MKRRKFYPVWATSVALLTNPCVFACSCIDVFVPPDGIFAGTVIDIAPILIDASTGEVVPDDAGEGADGEGKQQPETSVFRIPKNKVTLQVFETWKGSNTITKVVMTGRGDGDCGYPFERGSSYLVYSYDNHRQGYDGAVSICSPTRPYTAADGQFLGVGQKPIHPVLNILRNERTTIISWQTNWTGFRLEATESCEPPVRWQAVLDPVVVLGGSYEVIKDTTSPRAFFRLVQ